MTRIGRLTSRHVATRGQPICINVETARPRSNGHATAEFLLFSEEIWSIRFKSDGRGDAWKNTTIAVRSNRDRTAIAVRSSRNRSSCRVESTPRPSIDSSEAFGTRSTLDRGQSWPIVRRSWPIFRLLLKRNSSQFGPNLKPQCRSVQTASTTPRFRAHDRLYRPQSQA